MFQKERTYGFIRLYYLLDSASLCEQWIVLTADSVVNPCAFLIALLVPLWSLIPYTETGPKVDKKWTKTGLLLG